MWLGRVGTACALVSGRRERAMGRERGTNLVG